MNLDIKILQAFKTLFLLRIYLMKCHSNQRKTLTLERKLFKFIQVIELQNHDGKYMKYHFGFAVLRPTKYFANPNPDAVLKANNGKLR